MGDHNCFFLIIVFYVNYTRCAADTVQGHGPRSAIWSEVCTEIVTVRSKERSLGFTQHFLAFSFFHSDVMFVKRTKRRGPNSNRSDT